MQGTGHKHVTDRITPVRMNADNSRPWCFARAGPVHLDSKVLSKPAGGSYGSHWELVRAFSARAATGKMPRLEYREAFSR